MKIGSSYCKCTYQPYYCFMHQSQEEIKEEHAIIERAKIDPEAFGYIYEKYYQHIFLFIERRVDDYATAGDLTSQVFLKSMLNLDKYKFRGLPYSAWLYRIATNQVNEFYRESKNQRVISLEDHHIEDVFEEINLSKDELEPTELLIELLNELDEDEIQLLELRFFEKRAFKEVAFILNITENNAKVKTYRIIDKLKKLATANL